MFPGVTPARINAEFTPEQVHELLAALPGYRKKQKAAAKADADGEGDGEASDEDMAKMFA